MSDRGAYESTLNRVEDYFDRTATQVWERLTSDAPVSRVRATVRAGRDQMRALMLSRLPEDLTGARVLDAGCGAGQMTAELAARGADVLAVDISPSLVEIAQRRLPSHSRGRVEFVAGDMLDPALGGFDYVLAMDSLIYYAPADIARAVDGLAQRAGGHVVFTVAPRTPALMAMWQVGKLFPQSDRSPVMHPHGLKGLNRAMTTAGHGTQVSHVERVAKGFYISDCMEGHA